MYKKGGTTSKKMGGKRKQMGGRSPQPAATFLEPAVARPFEQSPGAFVAQKGGEKKLHGRQQKEDRRTKKVKTRTKPGTTTGRAIGKAAKVTRAGIVGAIMGAAGGQQKLKNLGVKSKTKKKQTGGEATSMRDLKKKQREERKSRRDLIRADRKADRKSVRELKRSERLKRRDKVNDAGEEIGMSRSERRGNRKAVRKATRTFKKQERKARRTYRKAHRAEDKAERSTFRQKRKEDIDKKSKELLDKLNEGDSSSVKKVVDKKEDTKTNDKKTTDKKTTDKKETKVTNHGVTDNMSFSKAFRTARDSYGGKGGEFTWKGKKYHTGTKSESSKKEEKKEEKKDEKAITKKENPPNYVETREYQESKKDRTLYNLPKYNIDPRTGKPYAADIDNTGNIGFAYKEGGEKTSFNKAFAAAKKAGKKEFTWKGKKYNTNVKSDTASKTQQKKKDSKGGLVNYLIKRRGKKISKKIRKAEEAGQDSLTHRGKKWSVKDLKKRNEAISKSLYGNRGYRRRGGIR